MTLPLLPLFTSVGALLFEFSLAQYLAMNLGNSAFGYPFVVGVFLLAMGAGAFLGDRVQHAARLKTLLAIEVALACLCLGALPFLGGVVAVLKGVSLGAESCRTLLCEAPGLGLAGCVALLLVLAGVGVGAEVPLFLGVFSWRLGSVLAADYLGAFLAGVLFPLLTLPALGLVGTLALAGLLHGLALVALVAVQSPKKRWLWGLALTVVGASVACVVLAESLERRLLERLVARPGVSTEVSFYRRSRKQSVLLVRQTDSRGKVDRRLFLDGYLQSASQTNERAYHEAMVLPARKSLGKERARVLVLGGADGLAAEVDLSQYPGDDILIVDLDEEFLAWAREEDELVALAPVAARSPRVSRLAADAFWFVRSDPRQWDLILVDFPHGVGDGASARVESWEFFLELRARLGPGGRVVVHHERYGSDGSECVGRTLEAAGFVSRELPVSPSLPSEAMWVAELGGVPRWSDAIQTQFRLNCLEENAPWRIWTGS